MDIKAVIYDYGNVLTIPQTQDDLNTMVKILDSDFENFNNSYYKFRDVYDGGEVNGYGYWKLVSNDLNKNLEDEKLHFLAKFDLDSWYNQNVKMWDLVLKTKQNYKTALLSNNLSELVVRMEADLELDKYFDVITFSYIHGIVKPDKRLYHHCLEDLNLKAEETIFIDDREINIRAANEMGINGILFKDYDTLIKDLNKYNLIGIN